MSVFEVFEGGSPNPLHISCGSLWDIMGFYGRQWENDEITWFFAVSLQGWVGFCDWHFIWGCGIESPPDGWMIAGVKT